MFFVCHDLILLILCLAQLSINLSVRGVARWFRSGPGGTGMARYLGWKEAKLALGEGRIPVLIQYWPTWSVGPESTSQRKNSGLGVQETWVSIRVHLLISVSRRKSPSFSEPQFLHVGSREPYLPRSLFRRGMRMGERRRSWKGRGSLGIPQSGHRGALHASLPGAHPRVSGPLPTASVRPTAVGGGARR